MTSELQRDHTGLLHLFANGAPVQGAVITGIDWTESGHVARVAIPLTKLKFAEVSTVVPFVVPARRAA